MTINGVMSTATQAINAQTMAIGAISDNVANAGTAGYKSVETLFLDMVQSKLQGGSPVVDSNRQMGVVAYADFANRKQGTLVEDASATSAAVSGAGFFPVAKATGYDAQTGEPLGFETTTYYTRQGDFHLDNSGRLVNAAGYYLMAAPANGTGMPGILTIDTSGDFTGVSIEDGGKVTAHYGNGTSNVQAQILLANFIEPDNLDRVDGTAFLPTGESGSAVYGNPGNPSNNAGVGAIKGGMLEQSTVDTADQMTKLILAQQAYSMNSQVLQAANQMMTTAVGMKG